MTFWQQVGAAGGGLFIAISLAASAYQSWRASRNASQAATNSHPISNGWGQALRENMQRQTLLLEQINGRLDANDRRQNTQDERLQTFDDRLARLERPRRVQAVT